jgi:hypothetical protein
MANKPDALKGYGKARSSSEKFDEGALRTLGLKCPSASSSSAQTAPSASSTALRWLGIRRRTTTAKMTTTGAPPSTGNNNYQQLPNYQLPGAQWVCPCGKWAPQHIPGTCQIAAARTHWRICQGTAPPKLTKAQSSALRTNQNYRQQETIRQRAVEKFLAWKKTLPRKYRAAACEPCLDAPLVAPTKYAPYNNITTYNCKNCPRTAVLPNFKRARCGNKTSMTYVQWLTGIGRTDIVAVYKRDAKMHDRRFKLKVKTDPDFGLAHRARANMRYKTTYCTAAKRARAKATVKCARPRF